MFTDLYTPSLALLTDLYQLTMAQGYWRSRMHDRQAVFHLFFRSCPFAGQYAIAAGLAPAVDWLSKFCVQKQDVDYLRTLRGNDSKALFSDDFLKAISGMRLSLDIDAMPEGTIAFAHQPLLRVTGQLWECQWVETALLNIINFQTLIATKAARVCYAAQGESVLEFGLRRAQGVDGAISASRAAFIGGCDATSNVLAGRLLDIPVRGTHAHSWVMSFDDELAAFEAYADAMPNNCVFLVDTYDTINGVANAIRVGRKLRESGHRMVGIRLDSGDLATLSIEARKLLDDAGFADAVIVASNDLDEHQIAELKRRGATIAVWGVGTNLVTARDQPALGGVYKLGAVQDDAGNWQPRIKLSDVPIKTSIPGILQVRRYTGGQQVVGDILFCEVTGPPETPTGETLEGESIVLPADASYAHHDLLQRVMSQGKPIGPLPTLAQIQSRVKRQLELLPPQTRSIERPSAYPVGLETGLARHRRRMIAAG
jgi:nicotinate phosphoribosyltransferase